MKQRRLIVVDPGHFHAALTLRVRNPAIDDQVRVYAQDGPDLERFLGLVQAFNERREEPTHWTLEVHRGADYLERIPVATPGDLAVLAGRNDRRLATMRALHARGWAVLADKPWLIDGSQSGLIDQVLQGGPPCMDIMTERHEIANRLQRALVRNVAVFGGFLSSGDEPAIEIRSVHHLYKMVNGRPLQRPPWYFDSAAQGEGITDVTTHLVDLVQWMVADGSPCVFDRDVRDLQARQWPTLVPRDVFAQVTGLPDFPDALAANVHDGVLHYLCNAALSFRLRGVGIAIEALWGLQEPPGSGDLHHAVVRGAKATLVLEQGPATGFLTMLRVEPVVRGAGFKRALRAAVAGMQAEFPGLECEADGGGFRMLIPRALRTTHEQHFALVLAEFLRVLAAGAIPAGLAADTQCKYRLLARAREVSERASRP